MCSALRSLLFVLVLGACSPPNYTIVLPPDQAASVQPVPDLAVVPHDLSPAPAFQFEFRCLASPTCGFKFFFRTPQKTLQFRETTVARGEIWSVGLPMDNVCDTPIVDANGLVIGGQPAGNFIRGLELSIVSSLGDYHTTWGETTPSGHHAPCNDVVQVTEHGIPIPLSPIKHTTTGSINCLISEDFLHGTPDNPACVSLR